jgi:hypothetical protein
VYHFRKTDLSQYTPCIATFEDDETFDVSHWCAGFTLGFEAKQSLWADKMDEPAWTDVHAVMALKEADETGRVSVHEDLDADERALRLHQDTLVELMRREISAMLEEPVDNLTLLLFVLADLQEVMLTQQAKSRSSR